MRLKNYHEWKKGKDLVGGWPKVFKGRLTISEFASEN
jgi:hypothetical protein